MLVITMTHGGCAIVELGTHLEDAQWHLSPLDPPVRVSVSTKKDRFLGSRAMTGEGIVLDAAGTTHSHVSWTGAASI